jgi:poly-gamma-glutamate synthesis protein (capsule biosynthesis protein)
VKTIAYLYFGVAFCLVFLFVSFLVPQPQVLRPEVNTPKTLAVSIEPVETEMILTGDVMLGRTVETKSAELGDYSYPFRKVAGGLREADIVFINLENPIIEDCPPHSEGFKLCSTPKMLEGLVLAGVDIVNLANNHAGNYGEEGVQETRKLLTQKGIAATGLGELVILEKGNSRFGFLGFDLTQRNLSSQELSLIRGSKDKVDVLVASVHWGVEYTDKPTDTQRTWARQIVLAGADVLVGHHPHWVQSSEMIDEKPIYYSLGNFVFDQMWSEETKKGKVLNIIFKEGKIESIKEYQTYMFSWAQPSIIEGED